MLPDSVGRGKDDGIPAHAKQRQATLDLVKKVASTGYVRSNLYVLNSGGADKSDYQEESAYKDAGEVTVETAFAASTTTALTGTGTAEAVAFSVAITNGIDRTEEARLARLKGYTGDACGECGNFTLVRNGTCLKCMSCGATSGCS